MACSAEGQTQQQAPPRAATEQAVRACLCPRCSLRVLLAFAIESSASRTCRSRSALISSRVLNEKGMPVRDLPQLQAGISKESLSMAMGVLRKKRLAVIEAEERGSRTKVARVTAKGREVRDAYRRLLGRSETLGDAVRRRGLRRASRITRTAGGRTPGRNHPGFSADLSLTRMAGERRRPNPRRCPHFPMVVHRGGFPDGS